MTAMETAMTISASPHEGRWLRMASLTSGMESRPVVSARPKRAPTARTASFAAHKPRPTPMIPGMMGVCICYDWGAKQIVALVVCGNGRKCEMGLGWIVSRSDLWFIRTRDDADDELDDVLVGAEALVDGDALEDDVGGKGTEEEADDGQIHAQDALAGEGCRWVVGCWVFVRKL